MKSKVSERKENDESFLFLSRKTTKEGLAPLDVVKDRIKGNLKILFSLRWQSLC
jgi:hypothetical protein